MTAAGGQPALTAAAQALIHYCPSPRVGATDGTQTLTLQHSRVIAAEQSPKEATVFDLRTEAEMRLHSEKTARELALKRQGDVDTENTGVTQTPAGSDE